MTHRVLKFVPALEFNWSYLSAVVKSFTRYLLKESVSLVVPPSFIFINQPRRAVDKKIKIISNTASILPQYVRNGIPVFTLTITPLSLNPGVSSLLLCSVRIDKIPQQTCEDNLKLQKIPLRQRRVAETTESDLTVYVTPVLRSRFFCWSEPEPHFIRRLRLHLLGKQKKPCCCVKHDIKSTLEGFIWSKTDLEPEPPKKLAAPAPQHCYLS